MPFGIPRSEGLFADPSGERQQGTHEALQVARSCRLRLLAASGPTLLEAYNRAEIVEDSAQAYLHCRLLGREPNLNF